LPLFLTEDAVDPTPPLFVGRDQQLGLLNHFLDQALAVKSQIAFISGEAGSGKTALMHAFARGAMAEQASLLVASGKCSAYTGSGDPYQPFLEITSMLTGDVEPSWQAGDISTEHAHRLWSILPQVTQALVENGRLLLDRFVPAASLFTRAQARTRTLPPGSLPWLDQLAQWVQSGEMMAAFSQTDLFEQFLSLLEILSRQHPLLLLLDDLQWIDQGSLNLLFHLGQHLRGGRILILGAYRPEDVKRGLNGETHPLVDVVNELQRIYGFDQVDLEQAGGPPFIDALLDSEPNQLDEEFRQSLFSQTGGHALFTVELLNGLRERGDLIKDENGNWVNRAPLEWDILPARIEAVIAARIARLPDICRQALTIASVEGEAFTAEVVAHIQNAPAQDTVRCLSGDLSRRHRLVTAQSRQLLGDQHLSHYRFQHYLIQHYIYSDLDPVERTDLHEAVGDTLEKLYAAREADLATIFGQLAWHYQEAGVLEKAIEYCQKAGKRAWQLSAAHESITYLKQGLDLLHQLPVSPERKQQELTLQIELVPALQASKGFAAPEVQATYDRIYLLSQQVGETPQLFFTRSLLGSYYMTSGQYHNSLKLGQKNFEMGQRLQDGLQTALARLIMAANYSQLDEFDRCQEHLDKMLAFYNYRQHHALSIHFGIDPGVNTLVWAALVLWIRGYPDQAEQQSQKAINLANILDHPFSQTTALEVGAGIMHIMARNYREARADLERSLAIADSQNFGLFQVEGRFYQGFLLVAGGHTDEGLEQMKQSLAAWRATGMRIMHSVVMGLLAQALQQAGQVEEGLQALDQAFSWVEERDERIYEAELYRIKGDLLQLRGTETAAVETAYRQAVTIARRQAAKSWELRATMSLAKLWQTQGQIIEARSTLSSVFDWFTEGFETPDLQDALALLSSLNEG
jgi:predicted ATPase